ncbi:MAG: helix-turn-helix domain-containing protein [Aestuariivirga sp.]
MDALSIDLRIAQRLKSLRSEREWSLDDLASRSSVSRATLSRLENAEVSPTAAVLGKLCSAYDLTVSRLMFMVEDGFVPLLRRSEQPVWADAETGFERRNVSLPAQSLAGEVIECSLRAGTRISYDRPPRPGLEHHLVMLEGELHLTIEGRLYELKAGDCLRYQLHGGTDFATPPETGARYLLFLV